MVIAPASGFLLLFNHGKRHSYLGFSFMSSGHVFYCLFWGFQRLNTHTVPCSFVETVEKRFCYLSVRTLRSKNIHCSLFSSLLLSKYMLVLPLPGILIWKYIKEIYLVAVYTLNTRSTPNFFVYNREKRNIYSSWCPFAFKTSYERFLLVWNF